MGHHAIVAAHLLSQHGTDQRNRNLHAPAPTICAGGNHAGLVAALRAPYYGSGEPGRDLPVPAPTVTRRDRLQLVTVSISISINGETYVLIDIGMRMRRGLAAPADRSRLQHWINAGDGAGAGRRRPSK